ncbi:TRCF domain-containing protein [Dictyobacter kobayashii]
MKVNFYQRLANLKDAHQVEAMTAEMTDRFGPYLNRYITCLNWSI